MVEIMILLCVIGFIGLIFAAGYVNGSRPGLAFIEMRKELDEFKYLLPKKDEPFMVPEEFKADLINEVNKISHKCRLVTAPGGTLLDSIMEHGITSRDLAERIDEPYSVITGILEGELRITKNVAIKLDRLLGIPESFWINRQRIYDEYLYRKRKYARSPYHFITKENKEASRDSIYLSSVSEKNLVCTVYYNVAFAGNAVHMKAQNLTEKEFRYLVELISASLRKRSV